MATFDISEAIFGKCVLAKLCISRISPDKVTMRPQLPGDKCVVTQAAILEPIAQMSANANRKMQ